MKPFTQTNKLILAILIIVIIGAFGWLIYPLLFPSKQSSTNTNVSQNQNSNTTNINVANTNTQPTNLSASVDTSNWKTYRNEELGFEVKYSEGWFFYNEYDNGFVFNKNKKSVSFTKLEFQKLETEFPFIDIQIYDNPEGKDLLKWFNENQVIVTKSNNPNFTKKPYEPQKYNKKWVEYSVETMGIAQCALTGKNKLIYVICEHFSPAMNLEYESMRKSLNLL